MKSIAIPFLLIFWGLSSIAQDTSQTKDTSNVIFVNCLKFPYPLMGMDSFQKLRDSCMVYPKSEFENGIEGKVYLRFVIGLDSSLHKIEIMPDSHILATPAMVEESIRLLKLSGQWMPGSNCGLPMEVSYVMLFKFSINDDQELPPKRKKWWQKD